MDSNDLLDGETIDARRAREVAQANAEKTFAADLQWVMSSPRGRRFMWWLLGSTNLHSSSFHNSGSVMAFNEGRRNVGIAVQAELDKHCHPSYMTMLEEQRKP